jgi:hypothetical protein
MWAFANFAESCRTLGSAGTGGTQPLSRLRGLKVSVWLPRARDPRRFCELPILAVLFSIFAETTHYSEASRIGGPKAVTGCRPLSNHAAQASSARNRPGVMPISR